MSHSLQRRGPDPNDFRILAMRVGVDIEMESGSTIHKCMSCLRDVWVEPGGVKFANQAFLEEGKPTYISCGTCALKHMKSSGETFELDEKQEKRMMDEGFSKEALDEAAEMAILILAKEEKKIPDLN